MGKRYKAPLRHRPHWIKNMLRDMSLVLRNDHGFESRFHISQRGVPYVHVMLSEDYDERFQFCYFAGRDIFRIFDSNSQKVLDIHSKDYVILWFVAHRCTCVRSSIGWHRMDPNVCPLHDLPLVP